MGRHIWTNLTYTVQLTEQVRQADDPAFINL
jgi:hypothetical protein